MMATVVFFLIFFIFTLSVSMMAIVAFFLIFFTFIFTLSVSMMATVVFFLLIVMTTSFLKSLLTLIRYLIFLSQQAFHKAVRTISMGTERDSILCTLEDRSVKFMFTSLRESLLMTINTEKLIQKGFLISTNGGSGFIDKTLMKSFHRSLVMRRRRRGRRVITFFLILLRRHNLLHTRLIGKSHTSRSGERERGRERWGRNGRIFHGLVMFLSHRLQHRNKRTTFRSQVLFMFFHTCTKSLFITLRERCRTQTLSIRPTSILERTRLRVRRWATRARSTF